MTPETFCEQFATFAEAPNAGEDAPTPTELASVETGLCTTSELP